MSYFQIKIILLIIRVEGMLLSYTQEMYRGKKYGRGFHNIVIELMTSMNNDCDLSFPHQKLKNEMTHFVIHYLLTRSLNFSKKVKIMFSNILSSLM